ncbi:MAG: MASE1 domain-containing protein [Candidatus Acidiferrum sp.]
MASVSLYILLDRSTVDLQIWHGISAWYPPIGLQFALYLGLGEAAFPAMFLAGFLAGLINYHESPASLEFLSINPLIPTLYFAASRIVKKRLNADLQVHSMRDVLNLLGYSLGASLVAAIAGSAILLISGNLPAHDYSRAVFDWWIGDAVAISSVSTFLLRFCVPSLRRFLGICLASPEAPFSELFSQSRRRYVMEVATFGATLAASLSPDCWS